MKISGIYKIVNKLDGKCYVGSSEDILGNCGRFYAHKRMLRLHIHHCVHLQRAYNRDGKKNFEFMVIEDVGSNNLLLVEQKYLDIARKNPHLYYNTSHDAGKITMTEETRAKIGAKKKAWLSDPTRHHMYGKKHKASTIKKIRDARMKQVITRESIEKGALTRTGKKWPEHREKIDGMKNPNADRNIYTFVNINTSEKYSGYRHDFIAKYNLPNWYSSDLVLRGKTKRGWKLHLSPSKQLSGLIRA